jgi:hypothetical protein
MQNPNNIKDLKKEKALSEDRAFKYQEQLSFSSENA